MHIKRKYQDVINLFDHQEKIKFVNWKKREEKLISHYLHEWFPKRGNFILQGMETFEENMMNF